MERRTLLSLLTAAPVAAVLAACGSDTPAQAPAATDSLPPVTAAPTTAAPAEGPVEAILEFGYYGGFTTREIAFQMQPQVLVTNDGHVITPAVTTAIYPGPLLPADNIQTITPEGVDRLIDAAREAGMLADVSYEASMNIADASTATLRLTVDGTTYVHEAYALGIGGLDDDQMDEVGGDSTSDRAAFQAFADQLADLPTLVGPDALGPAEPYRPDAYQLTALPAGDLSGLELEPTLVDWPADSGVSLADSSQCVETDAANVGAVLESADQLTYFIEDDVTYSVIARPAYPGRSC